MPSRLGSLTQSTKDRVIKKIKEITEKQIDTISSLDNAHVRIVSDPVTINHNGDSSRRVYASYYHLSTRVYSGCSLQSTIYWILMVFWFHPAPSLDGMVRIESRKQLYDRGIAPWPTTPVNALCLMTTVKSAKVKSHDVHCTYDFSIGPESVYLGLPILQFWSLLLFIIWKQGSNFKVLRKIFVSEINVWSSKFKWTPPT